MRSGWLGYAEIGVRVMRPLSEFLIGQLSDLLAVIVRYVNDEVVRLSTT
jgi:hypothetical protein